MVYAKFNLLTYLNYIFFLFIIIHFLLIQCHTSLNTIKILSKTIANLISKPTKILIKSLPENNMSS